MHIGSSLHDGDAAIEAPWVRDNLFTSSRVLAPNAVGQRAIRTNEMRKDC
jgi:hypothetical protein